MVDILDVDQDLNLLYDLILADSLAAKNLSIEVSVYDDTEGAHEYEFPERSNGIHNIVSEEKAGYIHCPVSTYTTISDDVSATSSTPDICEHTPDDYIFEDKEWIASDDEPSNNSKMDITIYAYLRVFTTCTLKIHPSSFASASLIWLCI